MINCEFHDAYGQGLFTGSNDEKGFVATHLHT